MPRRKLIVIIVGFFAVLILFSIFFFKRPSLKELTNIFSSKVVATKMLYDTSGQEIPLNIYYDQINGLVVSGVISSVQQNNENFLVVDTELQGETKKIVISPPSEQPIVVLKLPGGKQIEVQEWRGFLPSDLKEILKRGIQAMIYIDMSESDANATIEGARQKDIIKINGLTGIIIPE